LLTPESLDRLITDALRRRQAAERLLSIAERVAAAGGESVTAAEIDAEVRAEPSASCASRWRCGYEIAGRELRRYTYS
jgi:hypothetical protein